MGDELRTVVRANELGYAPHGEQLGQGVNHVFAGDAAINLQYEALARVLVDDREPLERAVGDFQLARAGDRNAGQQ